MQCQSEVSERGSFLLLSSFCFSLILILARWSYRQQLGRPCQHAVLLLSLVVQHARLSLTRAATKINVRRLITPGPILCQCAETAAATARPGTSCPTPIFFKCNTLVFFSSSPFPVSSSHAARLPATWWPSQPRHEPLASRAVYTLLAGVQGQKLTPYNQASLRALPRVSS